jgi:hypothetical protein
MLLTLTTHLKQIGDAAFLHLISTGHNMGTTYNSDVLQVVR